MVNQILSLAGPSGISNLQTTCGESSRWRLAILGLRDRQMNLGLTWASSLMRWCVPGFLIVHGGNLDFLAFHVLADVENCDLS